MKTRTLLISLFFLSLLVLGLNANAQTKKNEKNTNKCPQEKVKQVNNTQIDKAKVHVVCKISTDKVGIRKVGTKPEATLESTIDVIYDFDTSRPSDYFEKVTGLPSAAASKDKLYNVGLSTSYNGCHLNVNSVKFELTITHSPNAATNIYASTETINFEQKTLNLKFGDEEQRIEVICSFTQI